MRGTSTGATAEAMAEVPPSLLLAGLGATNRAVARALLARGHTVAAFDDGPTRPRSRRPRPWAWSCRSHPMTAGSASWSGPQTP